MLSTPERRLFQYASAVAAPGTRSATPTTAMSVSLILVAIRSVTWRKTLARGGRERPSGAPRASLLRAARQCFPPGSGPRQVGARFRGSAVGAAREQVAQTPSSWVAENVRNREVEAEGLSELTVRANGEQGMPSELEEIVRRADAR